MARYSITQTEYKCPNCGKIIKLKTSIDSCVVTLLCLLFFIIFHLTKFIICAPVRRTSLGEKIIKCRGCEEDVVLTSFGTRLLNIHDDLEQVETFSDNNPD